MTSRPVSRDDRSRTRSRSVEPRSRTRSRSDSRNRRSPSRDSRTPPRRNGRYRDDSPSRSRSRGRGRDDSRLRSRSRSLTRSESPLKSTKVSCHIACACEPHDGECHVDLYNQIVVERLTKNVNEDHLREIFGQYGPIEDLDLPINRSCKYSTPHQAVCRDCSEANLHASTLQTARTAERHTSCSSTR